MDINAVNRAQKIYNIYNNQNAKNTNRASRSQENMDSVSLSAAGEEFSAALNAIRKAPDINSSKVDDLKEKVQSGSYYVNTEDLADKILQNYNNSKNE